MLIATVNDSWESRGHDLTVALPSTPQPILEICDAPKIRMFHVLA